MQVIIKETTTVYPSSPPFNHDHVLPLSHLDTDRNLDVTFRYFRAYVNKTDKNTDPLHVITTALSTTLSHYYQLTGSFRRRASDGRLELCCIPGKGVPVVRASVENSLSSFNYLDDPEDKNLENLIPDWEPQEVLKHPFALQVTVFGCGGFVVGVAVHHAMNDGMGGSLVFNAMAELARGAKTISVEPVWDRSTLLGPREPARLGFPVEQYLRLDKGFSPYTQSDGPIEKWCFDMKEEWLNRLKGLLAERCGSKFTTFEALGAYIWRARVKASGVAGDEKVKFAYSINIRRLVKPALPAGYWGNGCVPMFAQTLAKDLVEKPIWETADLIKKSKFNATDEYVRSFIDFQQLHYHEGITAGKGVSGFTDWRHLGHSTVDFGWGGPVTVLPLTRHLLGSTEPSYFLPYSSAKEEKVDGFKVLVHLQEKAMPEFKAEMDKFFRMEFGLSPL
nr:putative coumarin synthase [Angelica dahurica]